MKKGDATDPSTLRKNGFFTAADVKETFENIKHPLGTIENIPPPNFLTTADEGKNNEPT